MDVTTASQVITFASEMERDIAELYEGMSRQGQASAILLGMAAESRKNAREIETVYYGVITDAFEGCFAFHIDGDAYSAKPFARGAEASGRGLGKALAVEQKAQEFYSIAAGQCAGLLADIPRLFNAMAKKREDRISKLKEASAI